MNSKHIDDLPPVPGDIVPVVVDNDSPTIKRFSVPTLFVESDVELEMEQEAARLGGALRTRGYKLYLEGNSPVEIARLMSDEGVSVDAVILWARQGEWAQRLKKKNDARELLVKENIRRIRLSKAEEDVESSLRIGKRIREVVEMKLEDPDSLRTQDIKNLADAGKASSDTSARGMGESVSDDQAGNNKGGGKTPLVMIFPGGGLPPLPKNTEVVNVKGSEG